MRPCSFGLAALDEGKIESGQLCTVAPITDPATIKVGDIVLCSRVRRPIPSPGEAIHGGQFQIGNNRDGINGWVTAKSLFGRLVEMAD